MYGRANLRRRSGMYRFALAQRFSALVHKFVRFMNGLQSSFSTACEYDCEGCLPSLSYCYPTQTLHCSLSGVGSQHDWPSYLREILGVPVSIDDGLPRYICRSCAGRVETLECKLKAIRQLAYESADKYKAMQVRETSVSSKRPKNTCGEVGVSPSTASPRPLAKRMYTDL